MIMVNNDNRMDDAIFMEQDTLVLCFSDSRASRLSSQPFLHKPMEQETQVSLAMNVAYLANNCMLCLYVYDYSRVRVML